jgi:hypothetical protein
MGAVAALGLSLLGFGGAAHADDVTVQPAPGSGFVVTDNTGAAQRFKVLETGPIFLGGLVGSPPIGNQALCYDTMTGQLGACPSAKNLAFCVPNAAASPRFVDNGDLTITDRQTCLMWEQKIDFDDCSFFPMICSSQPRWVGQLYTWSVSGTGAPDGGLFMDFLPRLNGQLCDSLAICLAGHSDWRVPTFPELQTIVDSTQGSCGGGSGPCIDPVFGPTAPDVYWSSTTGAPTEAADVNFSNGVTSFANKALGGHIRAVRGGL